MPGLADPRELVALSTFPFRAGGENCAHLPENAIEDMGAGMLSSSSRSASVTSKAPRPPSGIIQSDPSTSARATAIAARRRSAWTGARHSSTALSFSESGRRFYAYVAFGADTPSAIRTQTWTILDRLDVKTAADS